MAKKKSTKNKKQVSTRAMQGERTLEKTIPSYSGTADGDDLWPSSNGWNGTYLAIGGTNQLVMYETYFDLSGYMLDDLTLIPISGMVQAPGLTIASITNEGTVEVLDIISQQRLDGDEVYAAMLAFNVPGMPAAPGDYQRLTFGQYKGLLGQASFTNPTGQKIYSPVHVDTFGSGEPVAAQKLWIYRFFITPRASSGDLLVIPASRFILNAMIIKQSDKEYFTSLARSYSST